MSDMAVSDFDFGVLSQQVKNLQESMEEARSDIKATRTDISLINQKFDRIDGGWRVLIVIGGVAGTVGAAITAIAIKAWPFLLGTLPRI